MILFERDNFTAKVEDGNVTVYDGDELVGIAPDTIPYRVRARRHINQLVRRSEVANDGD